MRIALVQPKFSELGGAERYGLNLAKGLADRGHEVDIFCRRCEKVPPSVNVIKVFALPLNRAVKTRTFQKFADRKIGKASYDIVQGFGKTTCQTVHRAGGGIHRAFVERRGTPPDVYDEVAINIEDAVFGSEKLKTVICPSEWVAREILRYYPAVEELIRIIPNGLDIERFSPENRGEAGARLAKKLGLGNEARVIGFAGTNFKLKGLDCAIEALPLIDEGHLVVAGGDERGPFIELAKQLGVGERLHFLGFTDDPVEFYRSIDVLVHPTRWDTFGNVISEAMGCGAPVVTTELCGAADLLKSAKVGRVVADPKETEALARAVNELLGDLDAEAERAVTLARDCGQARHLDKVEELYREVAEELKREGSG